MSIFDGLQEYLASKQVPYEQGTASSTNKRVNRSGPAVPPMIPMPTNQGPYSGFMGQAFNLSGVPVAGQPQPGQPIPGQPAPPQTNISQLPPQLLAYLQALNGGQNIGITRIPYAGLLEALRGIQ